MLLDLSAPPVFLTDIRCRLKTFKKGEQHQNRTPYFSTLVMVISGTLSFLENGEEKHIRAGEYYIQRANTNQEGIPIKEPPVYYYIHFSGVFKEKTAASSIPLFGIFDLEVVQEQCTSAIFGSNSRTEEMFCFYNILMHLKKHNTHQVYSLAVDMSDYISRHIAKIENIEDLCRRFNYSKDHIIRVFRESFGITPYKYIINEKIKLAKGLLKSTNLTVAQIAENCGYRDLSVFYRAFKSVAGKSPVTYRNEHETNNA